MGTFASLWAPAFLKKWWSHNIDCSVYMCIKLQCQHLHLQHLIFAFLGSREFAASGRFYLLCILGNRYAQSVIGSIIAQTALHFVHYLRYYERSKPRVGLWDGSFCVSLPALYYSSAIFIRHIHLLLHFFHLYRSRQHKMQYQGKGKHLTEQLQAPWEGKVTLMMQTTAVWGVLAYSHPAPLSKVTVFSKQVAVECMFCRSRMGDVLALQPLLLMLAMLRHPHFSIY